jgi:hypothetical protein
MKVIEALFHVPDPQQFLCLWDFHNLTERYSVQICKVFYSIFGFSSSIQRKEQAVKILITPDRISKLAVMISQNAKKARSSVY